MAREGRTLERSVLYRKVWEVPMQRLAPDYGISDVALKKICRKMNIPTPPRGYWAKVQNGQRVPVTPLPKAKHGNLRSYEITAAADPEKKRMAEEAPRVPLLDDLERLKPIRVPLRLRNPHPLVAKTMKALERCSPDKYGALQPQQRSCLHVRVAPGSVKRALRIMSALVKGMEQLGIELIEGRSGYSEGVEAVLYDEKIRFSMYERMRRTDHVLTAKEEAEKKIYRHAYTKPWDFHPTGRLTLKIDRYYGPPFKKEWTDTAKRPVEDCLGEFMTSLIRIADYLRRKTIAQQEAERRAEERRRIAEEEARRKAEELRKLKELETLAARWARSNRILSFVQAVEEQARARGVPENEKVWSWIRWAREQAMKLSPLKEDCVEIGITDNSYEE